MRIFRGCLLLVTGFLMTACAEEPAPTAWDFECELTWYHDDPDDGGESIAMLDLGPYEDLGSADEAVDMCAAEQEDHEQRPPHAIFYKCDCAVVGGEETE